VIKRYESTEDFATAVRGCSNPYGTGSFVGHMEFETARLKTLQGDDSYVAEAEKLLDLLDASVETPHAEWVGSVYGAYPIVPEFLAGSPTPMRHRQNVEGDNSPITIYVSTTCSAGISTETMLKRGVAILALVLKMQQIRPIELCLLAETHGRTDGEYLQVIPIITKPVDISVAAFTLCHVAFARQLTYGAAIRDDKFNGSWPNTYNGGGAPWEAHVREALGMAEQDLYIGSARMWDDMITKPVEWVNAQVKRFTEVREGE